MDPRLEWKVRDGQIRTTYDMVKCPDCGRTFPKGQGIQHRAEYHRQDKKEPCCGG